MERNPGRREEKGKKVTDPIDDAISLLAEALECDPGLIGPEDDMHSLEKWDSLSHMRLILRLEEACGVEMDTDSIVDLVSVQEIRQYLEKFNN